MHDSAAAAGSSRHDNHLKPPVRHQKADRTRLLIFPWLWRAHAGFPAGPGPRASSHRSSLIGGTRSQFGAMHTYHWLMSGMQRMCRSLSCGIQTGNLWLCILIDVRALIHTPDNWLRLVRDSGLWKRLWRVYLKKINLSKPEATSSTSRNIMEILELPFSVLSFESKWR